MDVKGPNPSTDFVQKVPERKDLQDLTQWKLKELNDLQEVFEAL